MNTVHAPFLLARRPLTLKWLFDAAVEEGRAAVALPGTIHETAAKVHRLSGCGIAVRCDHSDDAQVAALVAARLA